MSDTRPKLWITGISGFLGHYFTQLSAPNWTLLGTYHQKAIHSSRVSCSALDLLDARAVEQYFDENDIRALIHLAAMSKPNFCEQHPELAYSVNVEATLHLAKSCRDRQIPFLFASTDLVFNGTAAPYDETARTSPVSRYGTHKAQAEQAILQTYPEAIIARLPLMYGFSDHAPNFLPQWLNKLRKGEAIYAFTDEFRTTAHGSDVVQGLLLLLDEKVQGIWHLGGPERLSRYEFALQVAQFYGLNTKLVHPSLQAEVTMLAKRPPDVSLDSSKAMKLGYQASTLEQALTKLIPG